MKALVAWVSAALLATGGAYAQLALPGAAPDAPPGASGDAASKPVKRRASHRVSVSAAAVTPDPAAIVGRTLKLNGRVGELRLERGDDKALKIVHFSLMGEVVSNASQPCKIEIVADKPIGATLKGEPDGLLRYNADIPACPLSFDVVEDGVIVPPQNNACVFSAADCQASPSGLWGPDPAELDKDPKAVSKTRATADRSIQDSLRELEKRDKDAAASLAREESDFAADRDDLCHAYAAEPRLGFCASRLAQTRAALLAKRVAEAGPAPAKPAAHTRRKKTIP